MFNLEKTKQNGIIIAKNKLESGQSQRRTLILRGQLFNPNKMIKEQRKMSNEKGYQNEIYFKDMFQLIYNLLQLKVKLTFNESISVSTKKY